MLNLGNENFEFILHFYFVYSFTHSLIYSFIATSVIAYVICPIRQR